MNNGAPSQWKKTVQTSVRMNDEVKAIIDLHGLSAQRLFDMAVDAMFWIRDANGILFTTENHPLFSPEAQEKHVLRPPAIPIPRIEEVLTRTTVARQEAVQHLAMVERVDRAAHGRRDSALERTLDRSAARSTVPISVTSERHTPTAAPIVNPLELPSEEEYLREREAEDAAFQRTFGESVDS